MINIDLLGKFFIYVGVFTAIFAILTAIVIYIYIIRYICTKTYNFIIKKQEIKSGYYSLVIYNRENKIMYISNVRNVHNLMEINRAGIKNIKINIENGINYDKR